METNRILITARLYGAGGVETHLLNLCCLLVERGAQVTLATRFANPETPLVRVHHEIPVRIIDTPFARDLRMFRLSTAWGMAAWPTQMPHGYFDLLYTVEVSRFTRFLRRFVRRDGYVIGNRIGEPLREHDALDPTGCEQLSGCVVESALQADAVHRSHPSLPIAAIPLMAFVQAPPREPRHSTNDLRVAFLGRYHRAKGIYRLLDIWPQLSIQSARLDFYGHGAERDGLWREVRRRSLEGGVGIHDGWSTSGELTSILDNTDLLVLPSETEGLPLVLLESMAHGVPFVATDVGAIRTLAEDNPDVRVVPLDNESLKHAIEEMARAIRAGTVGGEHLQRYHQARYGYKRLSFQWAEALLHPEQFWKSQCTEPDGEVVLNA